jgi:hypothetical protein
MAHDTSESVPTLLSHLEQALGVTEQQALAALGDYLISTKAGRVLCEDLRAQRNQARNAA